MEVLGRAGLKGDCYGLWEREISVKKILFFVGFESPRRGEYAMRE